MGKLKRFSAVALAAFALATAAGAMSPAPVSAQALPVGWFTAGKTGKVVAAPCIDQSGRVRVKESSCGYWRVTSVTVSGKRSTGASWQVSGSIPKFTPKDSSDPTTTVFISDIPVIPTNACKAATLRVNYRNDKINQTLSDTVPVVIYKSAGQPVSVC